MSKLLTPKVLLPVLAVIAVLIVFSLVFPPVALPAIEIPAEVVFHVFGLPITNTLLTSWITIIVLIVVSYLGTRRMNLIPSGLQNVLEMVIEGFYDLSEGVSGAKWTRKFFPIVMTIFLFIIVSNWMGVFPFYGSMGWLEPAHEGIVGYEINDVSQGFGLVTKQEATDGHGYILVPFLRSAATDLNTTLALAVVSVLLTQYFGVRALGLKYFSKFIAIDFSKGAFEGIINIFVGILELVSEFAKIISFTFRLFGNIFAGEVLLGVMAFLIPYVVSLPFYGLELFVGFIQALVFMMLTLVFFTVATMGHGEESH